MLPPELRQLILLYLPYEQVHRIGQPSESFWYDYLRFHYHLALPPSFRPSQEIKVVTEQLRDMMIARRYPTVSFFQTIYDLAVEYHFDVNEVLTRAQNQNSGDKFFTVIDAVEWIGAAYKGYRESARSILPDLDINVSGSVIDYQYLNEEDPSSPLKLNNSEKRLAADLYLLINRSTGYFVDMNGAVLTVNYDADRCRQLRYLVVLGSFPQSPGLILAQRVTALLLGASYVMIAAFP